MGTFCLSFIHLKFYDIYFWSQRQNSRAEAILQARGLLQLQQYHQLDFGEERYLCQFLFCIDISN